MMEVEVMLMFVVIHQRKQERLSSKHGSPPVALPTSEVQNFAKTMKLSRMKLFMVCD